MIGLLLPSCLAALAGTALRRRTAKFRGFQFEWWELAAAAFALELLLYNPPIDSMPWTLTYGPWVWVATRLALLAAVLRNTRARGAWSGACLAMALGMALNTVVIVSNDGYMPQSVEAAINVWGPERVGADADPGRLQNTRPMDADSRLTWLGDVLPEPTWLPRANVLSVGDVVLALGMAAWIFSRLRAAGATGDGGDSRSIADVELGEDVLHVRFNRLHRDKQLVGNRPI
jgi:Family of unknown function (DUF5317)